MRNNTIQQVAKKYNVSSQEVIDFLNDKGISIDFAYQKIEGEILQHLEFELKNKKKAPLLYIADDEIVNFKPVTKPIEFWQDADISNLEKLIYKNLAFEKPKTEKIIGITPFKWRFIKIDYDIKYAKGVQFTLIEDTICEILKIKKNISLIDICHLLGFGNDTEIISETLYGLKKDDIVTYESRFENIQLTNKGFQDILTKQKSKPAISSKFELIYDYYDLQNQFARKIFQIDKASNTSSFQINGNLENFDTIKHLAEEQQPNYQSSKSGFILQEAIPVLDSIVYYEKLLIGIVTEDINTKNKNKIWVFNPYEKEISKILSNISNRNQELYNLITEKLYSEIKEQITDEAVKEKEQIDFDNMLIKSVSEKKSKKSIPFDFLHFLSPDSLDTVQFEEEMELLFEICKNQLWLIFPFARGYIIEKRIRLIEKTLKNNCEVFVCFSQNENKAFGDKVVIDDRALKLFEDLSMRYEKFCYADLPKFHEKRVFAYLDNKFKVEYSGSHNYMSFFVHKKAKGVRRENMKRLEWSSQSETEISIRKIEFFNSFLERLQNDLNEDKIIGEALNEKDKKRKLKYYKNNLKKVQNIEKCLYDIEKQKIKYKGTYSDIEKFIESMEKK